MDPISIAAGTAGLITFAANLVITIDSIATAIKKRPALLQEIAEDLQLLRNVLEDLSKIDKTISSNDTAALRSVLHGCETVMDQIDQEFAALKAALQRGRMARTYAKMTFSSKMESITALRIQLDKYKSTLTIAVSLRLLRSAPTPDLTDKIDELRHAVSHAAQKQGRASGWQNPIQQYLSATMGLMEASEISPTSSSKTSSIVPGSSVSNDSSDTLVGTKSLPFTASSPSISSASSGPHQNSVDFGTFDDWLAAFTPESGDDVQASNESDDPEHPAPSSSIPVVAHEATEGARPDSIHVSIVGLLSKGFRSRSRQLSVLPSDPVYKIIEQLHVKGYTGICGFRYRGRLLNPTTSTKEPILVEVTNGDSCYSISDGLKINADEPFEAFYDNFVGAGDQNTCLSKPITSVKHNALHISDPWDAGENILEISFARTLRVPEDGNTYGAPVLFAPSSLLQAQNFGKTLPPEVARKGGIMMPLYQREAIAINLELTSYLNASLSSFAIRCMAGTINIVDGRTVSDTEDTNLQDYIVAPAQARLDGFLSGPAQVKQSVAMPLGSGYTAEGQISGKETFGGIQLLVAPKFRGRGQFANVSQNATPKSEGLEPGSFTPMTGKEVHQRLESLAFPCLPANLVASGVLYPGEPCRPRLIREVLRELGCTGQSHIEFEPIYPQRIRIQLRGSQSYVEDAELKQQLRLNSLVPQNIRQVTTQDLRIETSPFLNMDELCSHISKRLGCTYVVLFDGNQKLSRAPEDTHLLYEVITTSRCLECQIYKHQIENSYENQSQWQSSMSPSQLAPDSYYSEAPAFQYGQAPQARYNSDTSNFSLDVSRTSRSDSPQDFSLGSHQRSNLHQHSSSQPRVKSRWDMGLAPGGYIHQEIAPDHDPESWNWHRACFINIQFINSVIFERMTGIPPPPCPITFKDYIKAKLPFYHLVETGTIDGNKIFSSLKTVGDLDFLKEIKLSSSMLPGLSATGCVVCEQNLVDSIVRPCNHIFCGTCINTTMTINHKLGRCAACQTVIVKVINFSAQMELPTKIKPSLQETEKDLKSKTPDTLPKAALDELPHPAELEDTQVTGAISGEASGLSTTNTQSNSLLHEAVRREDISEVQRLLDAGQNPSAHEYGGNFLSLHGAPSDTPSHIAARLGHCNILYLLHEYGADLHAYTGEERYQPIHEACAHGQNAMVLLLLMLDVDIEAMTGLDDPCQRLTPLLVAVKHGQIRTVKLLPKKGVHLGISVSRTLRPACQNCSKYSISQRGSTSFPELKPCHIRSLFHLASFHGYADILSFLLTQGFKPDHQLVQGGPTPLLCAAINGQPATVKLLAEAGANVDQDWHQHLPATLFLDRPTTSDLPELDTVEALLDAGTHLYTTSPEGLLLAHIAAKRGKVNVLMMLLNRDGLLVHAMTDWAETNEWTPLTFAVAEAQLACCDLLLSRGATCYAEAFEHLATKVNGEENGKTPPQLTFCEKWNDDSFRKQSLQRLGQMIMAHLPVIKEISKFILALLRLKEEELLSAILEHYFNEAPQNHETNQQINKFDFTDLVCHAAATENADTVKDAVAYMRSVYNDEEWTIDPSPHFSGALLEAALRDDLTMIDALLSGLDTSVVQQEAMQLQQKLSTVKPLRIVTQSYLRRRYSRPCKVFLGPPELADPIDRPSSTKSRNF